MTWAIAFIAGGMMGGILMGVLANANRAAEQWDAFEQGRQYEREQHGAQ